MERGLVFRCLQYFMIIYNGLLFVSIGILEAVAIILCIFCAIIGQIALMQMAIVICLLLIPLLLYLWWIPLKGAREENATLLLVHVTVVVFTSILWLVFVLTFDGTKLTFYPTDPERQPDWLKQFDAASSSKEMFIGCSLLGLLDVLSALFLGVAIGAGAKHSPSPTKVEYRLAPV